MQNKQINKTSYIKKNPEPPYDPVILLLGIYLKNIETLIWKNTVPPMSIAALFTIAKMWK